MFNLCALCDSVILYGLDWTNMSFISCAAQIASVIKEKKMKALEFLAECAIST